MVPAELGQRRSEMHTGLRSESHETVCWCEPYSETLIGVRAKRLLLPVR